MDWTVVIIAALGLAGTAAGTALAPIITARQSEQTWLRQRRVDLYSDALVHAEAAERLQWRLTDPNYFTPYDVGGLPTPVPADLIGARMDLYGDAKVRAAWQAFVSAWDRLRSQVEEDHPGDDFTLLQDDPGIRGLRQASEELSTVCRRQVVRR